MTIFALGDLAPDIDESAYVHPSATVIGAVTLGPEASVWPGAVLRGDEGEIRIGARTSIQDGSVIHTVQTVSTVIGDDCTIGHLVHIEGAYIHPRCLIGSGAIVLPEVEIGSGSLIGANALVTQGTNVPPNSLMLGVPARRIERPIAPVLLDEPVRSYRERAKRFKAELIELDYVPGTAPEYPQGHQGVGT